jgi:hypothetical protein
MRIKNEENEIDESVIEEIIKILPEYWKVKASELGALTRSRVIKNARDLLVLVLLYATSGKSIGGTSSILRISGKIKLNKNAVYERINKSEKWIRWMLENIARNAGLIGPRPEWLQYRRVMAVDATTEESKDAVRTGWNLHTMMDIFTLEANEIKLTDEKTGEKLSNFNEIGWNDIIIGDRAYGTIKSIEYARERGADYILRLKSGSFNIYDDDGKKIDIRSNIDDMKEEEYKKIEAYYKQGKKLNPINICIYRKKESEIDRTIKLTKKSNGGMRKVSEDQKFYAKYVIVGTSLGDSAERVLGLYRQRWQIEMLFKRLKGIFSLDELNAKKPETVRVWFYSKLLVAALCEVLDNAGRFSPCGGILAAAGQQVE